MGISAKVCQDVQYEKIRVPVVWPSTKTTTLVRCSISEFLIDTNVVVLLRGIGQERVSITIELLFHLLDREADYIAYILSGDITPPRIKDINPKILRRQV